MANVNLNLYMLYGLSPIVMEARPDEVYARAAKAKPVKWLKCEGSDKIFPDEYLPAESPLKVKVAGIIDASTLHDTDDEFEIDLKETKIGDIYAVTFVYKAGTFPALMGGEELRPGVVNVGKFNLANRRINDVVLEAEREFTRLATTAGIALEQDQIKHRFEVEIKY